MAIPRAALLPVLLSAVGCGGAMPLLHPAHTLPAGKVSMGAGVAAQFATGAARSAIDRGRAAGGGTGVVPQNSSAERDLVTGALTDKLVSPGLSPWVGARAGIGYASDAGVTWTGRSVRIDGRHAFESEHYALSIGLGLSGVLSQPRTDNQPTSRGGRDIPGVDVGAASGWGFDVPVLVGYRSGASLVQVWAGVRGGFEHIGGDFYLHTDLDPTIQQTAPVDAQRWFAGGLVGVAVQVEPFWLGAELDVAYQSLDGSLRLEGGSGTTRSIGATLSGLTLAPGGALAARF